MDVTDQDVLSVFGEHHDASFVVPKFQRGYDWSEDNWRKLWQDIENIGGRVDEHFLGTLILLDDEENNIRIVDGQQRLVTVSIIAMIVRDLVKEPDDKINLVLSPLGSEERRIRYDTPSNDEEYKNVYNGQFGDIENKSNLEDAYMYFKRRINAKYPDNPEELMDKIESMVVVSTELSDPVKAYPIFQAQNDRGEDVEPHVLARSRVLGAADRETNTKKRKIAGIWERDIERELKKQLGNPRYRRKHLRIRRPMTHILANSDVKTPTDIDKSDMYGVFETVVNSFDSIEDFVYWFREQVELYLDTLTCNKYNLDAKNLSDTQTCELLHFNLSNTQAELVSLAIYKTVDDKGGLRKQCFKLAAVLGMRLQLADYTATDRSAPISSAASDIIQNAGDGTHIKEILRKKINDRDQMPSDDEIRGALLDTDMYYTNQYQHRTEIKFSSLEEMGDKIRKPVNLNNVVVDHIAPKRTFEDDNYNRWREGISEKEFEKRKHTLGNLILIDEETHKNIQYEESPDGKMTRLKNVKLGLANDVFERYKDAGDRWHDEQIDNRTEYLTEELIRRWSLPV